MAAAAAAATAAMWCVGTIYDTGSMTSWAAKHAGFAEQFPIRWLLRPWRLALAEIISKDEVRSLKVIEDQRTPSVVN